MRYGIFQNVDSKVSHGIFQEDGGISAEISGMELLRVWFGAIDESSRQL